MRLATVVYAQVFIALGVMSLVRGDIMPVWAPVPEWTPAMLAYVTGLVSVACGVGLLVPRTSVLSARVLAGALALWIVVFRGRDIVLAPTTFGPWDGCAETVVMLAGAVALTDHALSARVARVLYALAMIPFGIAHVLYPKETETLIPSWIPLHTAWVYLTALGFFATAAAIATGMFARLATLLSAAMIAAFTLLVWVPHVASGATVAFVWSEFAISCALSAAAFVVADSRPSWLSLWTGRSRAAR